MDICRGVLRAMFLDYPLSKAVDMVLGNGGCSITDYIAPIPHLLQWRMKELTLTDTRNICERLKLRLESKDGSVFVKLMDYLCDNAYNAVFEHIEGDNPQIGGEHLFRWMELVRYIDTDLLVIAKMVNVDKDGEPRKRFLWDVVLQADMGKMALDSSPNVDLHAHLNVAYDRFHVHWIDMMNHFALRPGKKEEVKCQGDILLDEWSVKVWQYAPLILWKEKYADKSYVDWMGIASIIRFFLFRFLTEGKHISSKERKLLLECLDDCESAKLLLDECAENVSAVRCTAFSGYVGKSYLDAAWDYCVQHDIVDAEAKKSPLCLLIGERWLVYTMMYRIAKGNGVAQKMAPYFYLYLLIKNRCRMEHYMVNELVGLGNYNRYVKNSNSRMDKSLFKLFENISGTQTHVELRMSDKDCEEYLKDMRYPKWMKAILFVSKSNDVKASKSMLAKRMNDLEKGKIAGVDFAGSDTDKRPAEFAEIVRYLREHKINNLTYHVGENFYDLVDGLRAIEDVLDVLKWNKPNRLAHVLALLTDVHDYYEKKHYTMTMPRKMLEENLEWVRHHAPKGMDVSSFMLKNGDGKDGDIEIFKADRSIVDIVRDNQKRILKEIIDKEIPIETCPTSNLRIGYFDKYSELPTCSLLTRGKAVVTINTDAPGLLATSLENEYNLISLAMKKDLGESDDSIKVYMERMMQNARNASF